MRNHRWTAKRLQDVSTPKQEQEASEYVRRVCEEIQGRWSDCDRRRREHGNIRPEPYTIPEVTIYAEENAMPKGGVRSS